MTIPQLYIKLKELSIPENRYYLHGLYGSTEDDNRLALTIKKGRFNIEYEIYSKEKGEKHTLAVFSSEDEACQYIYKKLIQTKEIEDRYSK